MSTDIKRKRVLVAGAGAAGTAAAYSLGKSPERFQVEVWDKAAQPGGAATSELLEGEGDVFINDAVQGGVPTYRNTINLMSEFGFSCSPVELKVSFGKGFTAWTNYARTGLLDHHRNEIKRFGKTLRIIFKLEFIFVFMSISMVLRLFGFSDAFCYQIIYPLTALFFGTGNQTPRVSAVIIARVFLDDKLKLFDYDHERLLSQTPEMFVFPNLRDVYQTIMGKSGAVFYPNRAVISVSRREGKVYVVDERQEEDVFDEIIFACDAETILSALKEPTFMERRVMGNIEYYNDVSVTHEDDAYMDKHYELHKTGDMYFIRSDSTDPTKLEMSFNLSNYQPPLKTCERNIYQTIFLNDACKATWTMNEIDKKKIRLIKCWRKFSHTCRHFAFTVFLMRYIQGTRNTWFCGSYTMIGTHEAAIISGFAAASRLGANYPFPEDDLAKIQFEHYLLLAHGRPARYGCDKKTLISALTAPLMLLYLCIAILVQFALNFFRRWRH